MIYASAQSLLGFAGHRAGLFSPAVAGVKGGFPTAQGVWGIDPTQNASLLHGLARGGFGAGFGAIWPTLGQHPAACSA